MSTDEEGASGFTATQLLIGCLVVAIILAVATGALLLSQKDDSPALTTSPADYRPDMSKITSESATELTVLGQLMSVPRISDDDWRSTVSAAANRIKKNDSQLRNLIPPSCLFAAHQTLLLGTVEMDEAMDVILNTVKTRQATLVAAMTISVNLKMTSATRCHQPSCADDSDCVLLT